MYKYITSLNNPLVKEAARLRSRKGREHTGRFLIDGVREVSRASASGISLETVFMCEDVVAEFADRRSGKYETPFVSQVEGARVCHVTINVMEKLGYGDRNEGVVAIARTPVTTLDALDAKLPSSPLIAVVEGVEKPGNLGAVLRTADAAGIHAVIAADPVIDVYNPNVIRASLGAVFSIPVAVAAAAEPAAALAAEAAVPAPLATFKVESDAPACHYCGGIMTRNGSCYRCANCGSTSGCS